MQGGYEYQITIVPISKGSVISKKTPDYLQGNTAYPKENVSRGAIDNNIDKIKDKDRYQIFRNNYPQGKFGNPLEAWNSLTDGERKEVADGSKIQVKIWKDEGMNLKYVKSAANYLKEKMFKNYQIKNYIDSERKEFIIKHISRYNVFKYVSNNTHDEYYNKRISFEEVLREASNNGYQYYYPVPESTDMSGTEVLEMLNDADIINHENGMIQFKIKN